MTMSEEGKNILQITLKQFGIKFLQNLFIENSTINEYPKNEIIFYEDEITTTEYLLLEGILHRYNVNSLNENVTTGFYMAKVAVTPHTARTIKGKNIFTLQALTNSIIAEIPVSVLNHLRFTYEEYRAFGQMFIEAELSKWLYHDIAYRSMTAKNRLMILRKAYPNIENLVPHNIIASYLGITNVSFSRLRHESARE